MSIRVYFPTYFHLYFHYATYKLAVRLSLLCFCKLSSVARLEDSLAVFVLPEWTARRGASSVREAAGWLLYEHTKWCSRIRLNWSSNTRTYWMFGWKGLISKDSCSDFFLLWLRSILFLRLSPQYCVLTKCRMLVQININS